MSHSTLLRQEDAMLVVVDIQEKLMPAIANQDEVIRRSQILMQAAKELSLPILVSEQYPKGLGPTVEALQPHMESAIRIEKMTFSCGECDRFLDHIEDIDRDQVILCGVESHICVLQTALDLIEHGAQVHLAADAVGSRKERNRDIATNRIAQAGGIITCTESILFELLQEAGTPRFKSLSKLVREP